MRASSFDIIYIPEKIGVYGITLFCGNIPVPNRCRCKDAPSPLKRDGSSHLASKVLKEAEDLRDTADRLKVLQNSSLSHSFLHCL